MRDNKIFPVYIVVDVSSSMQGDPITAANQIVPALIDACRQYSSLADMLRFSLITFSEGAKTVIPMGSYDEAAVPTLIPGGTTSYGSAFREIRKNIDSDVADLNTLEYTVLRPSVFFITDGEPTDDTADRTAAWQDLTDDSRRTHPNVVAFGVGNEVTAETLATYTSHKGKAYVTRDGASAAAALRSIIELLVMSVVATANNAAEGSNDGLVLASAVDADLEEVPETT